MKMAALALVLLTIAILVVRYDRRIQYQLRRRDVLERRDRHRKRMKRVIGWNRTVAILEQPNLCESCKHEPIAHDQDGKCLFGPGAYKSRRIFL